MCNLLLWYLLLTLSCSALFETLTSSSVAKGGGGGGGGGGAGRGAIAPPSDMLTKMQNGKNTTFLALLRLLYAQDWIK